MHVNRIAFTHLPGLAPSDEAADHTISSLLGAWRMNGQVCGGEWAIAREVDGYSTVAMSPEAESLAPRFDRRHVDEAVQRLGGAGLSMHWESLGPDPMSGSPCDCAAPQTYALFTTYVTLEPPVRCLACFRPVALHRFEPNRSHEHDDVISWQSDYQSCDQLQMNCTVLERAATREMSHIDSMLSRNGRALGAALAESSRRPFYYYLYRGHGRTLRSELARPCPGCGGAWALPERLHKFDFKCDRCHLLSNIAFDLT